MAFCSQYAAEQVTQHLIEEQQWDLEAFLASSRNDPQLGTLKGQLLENFVFARLKNKMLIAFRDMEDGEIFTA